MDWITTLIVVDVVLILLWWITSPFYWKRRGVPSSLPLPIFGNSLSAFWTPMITFFEKIYNGAANAPYVGIHLFTEPALLIKDPSIVADILVKDADYFTSHGFYANKERDEVGGNMFFSEGQRWKTLRAKMSHTFTPAKVKGMIPFVTTSLEQVDNVITHKQGKSKVDVHDLMIRHSTHSAIGFIFGAESDIYEENSEFYEVEKKMFDPHLTIAVFIGVISQKIYNFFKLTIMDNDGINFIRKLTNDIIIHREKTGDKKPDFMQSVIDLIHSETSNNDKEELFPDGTTVPIFRSHEVVGHTALMFAAGIETTGLTMAFTLYEIALNQEVQRKIRDEINLHVPEIDKLSYEDLSKLTYTSMTISETLRKYPLLSILTRKCTKDYRVAKTGLLIEKGTFILVPAYGIQMDPKYYPDPEEFIPERFEKPKELGTYMPFGLGPRICLGMKLATMEMTWTLANLVSKYHVTLDPKMKVPLTISPRHFVTTPKDGIWVQFEPVN